jgi:hypothetical protein
MDPHPLSEQAKRRIVNPASMAVSDLQARTAAIHCAISAATAGNNKSVITTAREFYLLLSGQDPVVDLPTVADQTNLYVMPNNPGYVGRHPK